MLVAYNLAAQDVNLNGLVSVGGSLACGFSTKTGVLCEIVQVLLLCRFLTAGV